MRWFALLQFPVLAAILLWSGTFKLVGRSVASTARQSVVARVLPPDTAVWFFRAVGLVELGVVAALLTPPANLAKALAVTALSIGFVGYLGYSRIAAPQSSCGCLSAHRSAVGRRAVGRAALMVAMGATGALATGTAVLGTAVPAASSGWPAAVAVHPVPAALMLAVEAVLLVTLSPELDHVWLLPLRRLRIRLRHPLIGQAYTVPMAATVHQLQRSPAYRAVSALLRSDVVDTWDEDGWRMLTYRSRSGDRPATTVFAVRLAEYDPAGVRAVLTDDADDSVLWRFEPGQQPELPLIQLSSSASPDSDRPADPVDAPLPTELAGLHLA